jgi:hypothetical protein
LWKGKKNKERVWFYLEALVAGGVPPQLGRELEVMGLHRAEPRFFGLYLDSLLSAGNARKALYAVTSTLPDHPSLDWAHVAMRRLPFIWQTLGMIGFSWQQEDGIPLLLKKLEERRPRKVSTLIWGHAAV